MVPQEALVDDHVVLLDAGLELVRRLSAGHQLPDELVEVGPRAEVAAVARQDRDADVVVRVDRIPCIRQSDDDLRVDGVASFGAIEGDGRDMTVDVVENGWLRHVSYAALRPTA